MPKETRNDGSAMMRAYESVRGKRMIVDRSSESPQKESPKVAHMNNAGLTGLDDP